MIDLESAVNEFIKYTQKFDLENENIKRKQGHSIRVMSISKRIAEELNLSNEQIELATLIGLLHDIARFKQYTEYKTFNDYDSFDHGDKGVEILQENGFIKKFLNDEKLYPIIYTAIKNHNKLKIEEGLSKQELLYSKIIRDADKIDIIYEATCMFYVGEEKKIGNSIISERVLKEFNSSSLITRKKEYKLQSIDRVVSVVAFIFDINYKESFIILKQKDYINKILNRFNFKNIKIKEEIDKIRKVSNKYIEDKIKEC